LIFVMNVTHSLQDQRKFLMLPVELRSLKVNINFLKLPEHALWALFTLSFL